MRVNLGNVSKSSIHHHLPHIKLVFKILVNFHEEDSNSSASGNEMDSENSNVEIVNVGIIFSNVENTEKKTI